MADHFLAREDEQDRFVSVLRHALNETDGLDEGFLVVVQGHGGIGKTELLNRFADIVRGKVPHLAVSADFYLVTVDWSTERESRPVDYASWAGPPIWVAFNAIYVSLRDQITAGRARRRFEQAFADYRTQATKIMTEQPPEPEQSRLPEILGAAAGMIGGLAPVPGAVAVSGSAAKLAADVVQSAQSNRGRVDDKSYDTLIGPDDALVRAFASGLREVSLIRPLVIILDTVEILGEARRRIRQAAKRSGAKTVWVWGIRLEDEANAAEDSEIMLLRRHFDNARLRLVPLSRFDDKTVERYLQNRIDGMPITAELTRDVVALTRGIPLAVRLAATLLSNGVSPAVALREVSVTGETSEVISGLARRYLIHLTETPNAEMRADLSLIYGLALIDGRDSDPDLLAALWDVPASEVAQRLDELAVRHDFVLSGRHRMHQEIRRTIQLFLLDPVRRPEVRAANQRAVRALRDRMSGLEHVTTVEAQLADEEWCAAARQLLWHTFWVNISDGLRLLAELAPAAHTLAPTLATDLQRTAHWFEPVLTTGQRAVLAGTRLLLPGGSFMTRLQTEFRRAAERMDSPPAISSAMQVIAAAVDDASSVLAPDVPPSVFVLLLRLGTPVSDTDFEPVTALEQMTELLPESGARRLREIITSRVEVLTREVVDRPGTGDVAVQVSRAAVRFAPDNPALHALLARACAATGDSHIALAAIEEACRLRPGDADYHISRGIALRDLGRQEEALAAFQEACRLQPDNPGWHTNRGIALRDLGRQEEALAAYQEACRLYPNNADYHNSRGIALRDLGCQEEALAAFQEACRLQPDNAQCHTNRGIALARLGCQEEALAAFQEACRLQPDNADWHTNRGIALRDLGRQEEALAAFQEACRLQPDNPGWHNSRGIALRDLGCQEEALAAYQEACRLQPDNAQWHTNRGFALARLGRQEEALAACQEACRLQPDNAEWHNSRGVALGRLGRYEEALAAYDDGLQFAPSDKKLLNNRGEALMMLHRDTEAISAFRRSINLDGDHLESSVLLALLLFPNAMAEAVELCEAALLMDGTDLSPCRRSEMRALAHAIIGDPDDADRELRTALAAWNSGDVYQLRLYELLGSAKRESAEALVRLWRESGVIKGRQSLRGQND
jgi:tetratricopeptide (TPR) repeat protein